MKGDRLRCRECGRYRSTFSKIGDVNVYNLSDDAVVIMSPCPTDGCDGDTASLAGDEPSSANGSQGTGD